LPQPTSSPNRRPLLGYLVAQLAFGLVAMTICIPSMQRWGAIFDASQSSVQLTFSGFVVAYGGLQLLYGPLSDRMGRRRILLVGLVLAAAGSVFAALAPTLPLLTAARVLQGAGAAAGMVVGRAMVQDLFEGSQRTRVMAYIGMAMGLCPPLATIVGGQIHVRLGWQANFVLVAIAAVGLFVAGWRCLPRGAPPGGERGNWLRALLDSYVRLAREPSFPFFVIMLGMTTATFYAFLAGAPIVLGSYGVGPDGIGFYIMCIPTSYIVGNFLASRLARRVGERRLMVAGQSLTLLGLGVMLALGLAKVNTAPALAVPLMVLGLGHGILVPPLLAGTVGLVPVLAGSAAAVAGLMQQMMGALSGYAVGLVEHEGAVNLGLVMLAFTGVGAVALGFLLRRHGPGRPGEAPR
jgi:DHA1 family bicyclomycin/chloramphenicol resistance-like MFS transporter